MADYESVDFFTDESLNEDPYLYFDHLRARCPILPTAHHGVVAVSGFLPREYWMCSRNERRRSAAEVPVR